MLFCYPYIDLLHIYKENKKKDDNKKTKQQEILRTHKENKDSFGCVCLTKQEAKIFDLV